MSELFTAIVEADNFEQAWQSVIDNDLADGRLAPSIKRMAADPTTVSKLRSDVEQCRYRPSPLTEVLLPKDDGTNRTLHVPVAADRVVERAMAQKLTPLIDPYLAPTSFAYRPGRGVADAVRRLVELREEGFAAVVRTDIRDCFPTIRRTRLIRILHGLDIDDDVIDLVEVLIARPVRRGTSRRSHRVGIPQGSPLSPLLSNIYLDLVDRRLARDGHPHVRFADDFAVAALDIDDAHRALAATETAVSSVEQRLGSDKTEITTFEDGFAFLGEDFNARYPPHEPNALRAEPPRRTVYVGRQGARVRIGAGRLLVEKNQEELLNAPIGHVGRLVLAGSVGLSAGARSWALTNRVPAVFLSRRGAFLGTLANARLPDPGLRRQQYRMTDDPSSTIRLARRFVLGKISNQRALLMRYTRVDISTDLRTIIEELDYFRGSLDGAETHAELMGMEGIASRRYFEGLSLVLGPESPFRGRMRRPPGDVVNSALSYGYAVLCGEAVTACAHAGLEPAVGVLHSDHALRPSLALDLMEEFRPVVVDTVVAELFRRSALTSDHGRTDPDRGGVLLTERGRRLLLKRLEDRLLTYARHPGTGTRSSYRRAMTLQAQSVARFFRTGEVDYQPILWR